VSSGNTAAPWFPEEIASAIAATDSEFRVDKKSAAGPLLNQFQPPGPWEEAHDNAKKERRALRDLQKALSASRRFSVLAVFQALDAGGKDGAIRAVFKGVDPGGLEVTSFKRPSKLELSHDFLWRTTTALPPKGKIGIFNRSHYEDVLVVQVHPEYLDGPYGGHPPDLDHIWEARYRAIREHELHLACSNTLILKFWLNVSRGRQARRFLDRLDEPEKRWKFSSEDLGESRLRAEYDKVLPRVIKETSRPWAPWYCIPADERWYARWKIASIVRQALTALPLDYPEGERFSDAEIKAYRKELKPLVKET
jgi:PPK2 family polyphosphate:nucleotide phosphotransferase